MSNSKAAIVVIGAFATFIASFCMTYSVYKYGSAEQTSETTNILEDGAENNGG